MTQDVLLYATRRQVTAEQMVWRQVDSIRNPNGGIPPARWNPKRPVFTYEWQTVIDRQPDVARGALLDIFLRPDPDWSLVTRDPAWDTRFEALVVPTIFAREKVDGRDPSFAAQELAPVYKRHLELAASKAPTKLWMPIALPSYTYDFAARAIQFSWRMNAKPSTIGGIVVAADDNARESLQYVLPPAAQNLAMYPVASAGPIIQRAEPAPTNPGLRVGPPDAPDAWRQAFAIGSSYRAMPMTEVVALDRSLQITTLPMEPARAEALAKRRTANPNGQLTARVYFDADHVEFGERIFAGERSSIAVVVGKVEKLEVLDLDNGVIATMAASALPPPTVATAPSAPASRPPVPVPAVTTPRGPTAAETEAEVQRRNRENSQRVSDALNRATAEKVRQAMQAIEKENKCRAEAAKINKDVTSKPYQDAFAKSQAAK
jgi:hypothetical protein